METMNIPRTPDSVIRTSIETALRRLPDQAPQYRHAIYARARRTITENSPEHIAVLEEVIADLEREHAPDISEVMAGPEHDAPEAKRPRRKRRVPGRASVFFTGLAAILILGTAAASWWLYKVENRAPEAKFTFTPEHGYVLRAVDFPQGTMIVPEGFSVRREEAALRLSGNVEGATSAGRTAGISFTLPPEIERQASGKTATITIVGTSEKKTAIQIAYSTNEVGNTGWRTLEVGGASDSQPFTFRVPPAVNYMGDFIGILPDPQGSGNAILLEAIRLKLE